MHKRRRDPGLELSFPSSPFLSLERGLFRLRLCKCTGSGSAKSLQTEWPPAFLLIRPRGIELLSQRIGAQKDQQANRVATVAPSMQEFQSMEPLAPSGRQSVPACSFDRSSRNSPVAPVSVAVSPSPSTCKFFQVMCGNGTCARFLKVKLKIPVV